MCKHCTAAVSYTHLDVYKRQTYMFKVYSIPHMQETKHLTSTGVPVILMQKSVAAGMWLRSCTTTNIEQLNYKIISENIKQLKVLSLIHI